MDTLNPTLTTVTITSNNADPAIANAGDTVTISFTASEALIALPAVTKFDENAVDAVNGLSKGSYTATKVMQAGDTQGTVTFTIDFTNGAENAGAQVSTTTDASRETFN